MVTSFGVKLLYDAVVASVADNSPGGVAAMGVCEGMPHKLTQAGSSGSGVSVYAGAARAMVPVGCAIYASFEPYFGVVENNVLRAAESEPLPERTVGFAGFIKVVQDLEGNAPVVFAFNMEDGSATDTGGGCRSEREKGA